jgi:hypothetical protein
MVGMRRQTPLGKLDASAIEDFSARRNRDEDSRVAVLGHADSCTWLHSSVFHAVPAPKVARNASTSVP